ncbi:MAG: 2,3-bisphosphoglycerate-independent phosphoglycerate mutase [Candidatus Harrisonbacteria bacterium CG10_big_fil_rev_8_21_14_0_10_45_28]|uniref:2,3-bisphosphoglycerate-independent phosphoglycerate mutase n=1 Tax=Candidatus Harrisonbacteria bacterium CG10_big_fil_rev_8_21_14_0_10_45_28 TaxID=1974586 RepID=A0A2H0UP22_9BACT|nr:MAG: 2,3-bisphosphoglycerate-independent phosphoglycerate mutase [Candidatus Harrisonbacteria bacterium CG10_big_fil_rev_8_21_14_0_10_45_28]
MKPRVVLAILDGWGIGPPEPDVNPIYAAHPQTVEYIKAHYPAGALQASSIAVGLPWGEVGNSEVGHLILGAGKIVYQHYPRISIAIENGSFFKNEAFLEAFEHVKTNNSSLNIAGLLTAGNIHAAFDHLEALIEMASQNDISQVNLHLFADGKDSPPESVIHLLDALKKVIEKNKVGTLSTLTGRHFALDRDSHWDRTEAAYKAMTGQGERAQEDLLTIIKRTYQSGKNDQEIPPTMVSASSHSIKENDALIFIDFREDSIRQIAHAFIDKDIKEFPAIKFSNLHVVTMTEYTETFAVPVAFPNEPITHPLGKVLSDAGKSQVLLAETEKYAHVTYFFNGYQDNPFPGQEKVLIPSNNVENHAEKPEMKAKELTDKIIEILDTTPTDFIAVNLANADIVAHTGDYKATLEAVKVVDVELGRILKYCEANSVYLVITADHGNAEILRDSITAAPDTSHDPSPVPIYIIGKEFYKDKTAQEIKESDNLAVGILSDVAPTVLALLGVEKPQEMTGQNLLPILFEQ